jgi:cell division protein FtsB
MANENKNTPQDDEYQFPQDEYISSGEAKPEPEVSAEVPVESEMDASRTSKITHFLRKFPPIKNKRIVVVIVVVIALFFIFHFLNPSKKIQPVAQVQPVAVAPEPVVQQSNNDMGSLDSLRAHSSRAESQIHDLQAQLSNMQNSLSQMQTSNQTLQKSVADLTAQMQGMSSQLEAALSRVRSRGSSVAYHLRAVQPDRAWITSNTGQTVSVTLGDYVKQYGRVKSIDSQRGIIVTTSGRKIEYGPNDY